jgi:hypothetical protein
LVAGLRGKLLDISKATPNSNGSKIVKISSETAKTSNKTLRASNEDHRSFNTAHPHRTANFSSQALMERLLALQLRMVYHRSKSPLKAIFLRV